MSRSAVRRRRAVLVFAIASLPWAAASRVGEPDRASSGAVPNASTTLEAFTWMPVVASDRPSTLLFVRLAWETWLASPTARIVPLALHLAGRGPPLLAAA